MWDDTKSLKLSILVTRMLMIILVPLLFTLPWLGKVYLELRNNNPELLLNLIVPLYISIIPAAIALFCLDRMLERISRDEVFVPGNVQAIRIISWCCFAVCLISGIASFFLLPYVFIMAAMFFCGLISRVIKNVFLKAVLIKTENDFTI
jgi:hypothetical protein